MHYQLTPTIFDIWEKISRRAN